MINTDRYGKKRPVRPFDEDTERELFSNDMDVASATECTGLIPTPPLDGEEANSLSELYDIPLSKGRY